MARKTIKLHELQEASRSKKASPEKEVVKKWIRIAEKQQYVEDEEAAAGLLLTLQ